MDFTKSLKSSTDFLNKQNIPYMIFGGIATSIHGEPRQTFDIDIKIHLDSDNQLENFIKQLKKIAEILPENPIRFIDETSVLPVEIEQIRVDLVFASLPFEIEAIQNAQIVDYAGIKIKVSTAEDLIIHKVISERTKDWLDIEGIVQNKKNRLNWKYVLKHTKELSELLDNSGIYDKLIRIKNEFTN